MKYWGSFKSVLTLCNNRFHRDLFLCYVYVCLPAHMCTVCMLELQELELEMVLGYRVSAGNSGPLQVQPVL